jgi:hypothetical protein
MAILVLKPSLTLPAIAVRVLYVVGQASFTIFLLHVIFLRVYTRILGLDDQDGAWIFAMTATTLTWVAGSAIRRAYRRVSSSSGAGLSTGTKNILRPSPQIGWSHATVRGAVPAAGPGVQRPRYRTTRCRSPSATKQPSPVGA